MRPRRPTPPIPPRRHIPMRLSWRWPTMPRAGSQQRRPRVKCVVKRCIKSATALRDGSRHDVLCPPVHFTASAPVGYGDRALAFARSATVQAEVGERHAGSAEIRRMLRREVDPIPPVPVAGPTLGPRTTGIPNGAGAGRSSAHCARSSPVGGGRAISAPGINASDRDRSEPRSEAVERHALAQRAHMGPVVHTCAVSRHGDVEGIPQRGL